MKQQFENVFSFLDEIGKEIDKSTPILRNCSKEEEK